MVQTESAVTKFICNAAIAVSSHVIMEYGLYFSFSQSILIHGFLLFADGKDVAQKALVEQVHKALEWLKEEQNQEKLLNGGVAIAQLVLLKKLPQKK